MHQISLILGIPGYFLRGFFSALSSAKLALLIIGQCLFGIVVYLTVAWFSFEYRTSLTSRLLGPIDSWWEHLIAFLLFLVALIFDGFVTYVILMIIGGFVMEWLAQSILKTNGVPLDSELSLRSVQRMAVRTARVTAYRFAAGMIVLAMTGASVFLPVLVPITTALLFALVGFDFIELSLAVTADEVRSTVRPVRDYPLLTLAFGAVAAVLLAIPFAGVFFIPIAAGAAAHLVSAVHPKGAKSN